MELHVHPDLPGVRKAHDGAHDEGHDDLGETEQRLLAALADGPRSRADIATILGLASGRSGHLSRVLERLRALDLVAFTIPDKPKSKHQELHLAERGRVWLTRHKARRQQSEP